MTREFTEQKQAIGYFLGELSEPEQSAVEERFFTDADYSRFLDAVENGLVDDYVGGKLDFRQTQNFERNFLISERRREAVRLTQILQTETFAEKEKVGFVAASNHSFWQRFENLFRVPNLAWAGGLATIAILILLGGLWLVDSPKNNQIAQIEIQNPTPITDSSKSSLSVALPLTSENPPDANATQKQLLKPVQKPNLEKREKRQTAPPVESKPIPAFNLLPPMQSADKPLIVGVRKAENIRLRVVYNNAENFIKYRVEIHASDGDLVWSREIAVSEKTLQKPLALYVRRGALASGSYELTVSGATDDGQLEEINNYNFTFRK